MEHFNPTAPPPPKKILRSSQGQENRSTPTPTRALKRAKISHAVFLNFTTPVKLFFEVKENL